MQIIEPTPLSRQRAYVIGGFEKILVSWGLLTVFVYLVSFIASSALGLGKFRMFYLGSGLVWCLFAYGMTKFSLRLCFPIVIAFLMQLWVFVSTLHSWYVLHRREYLGRPELFILELLIPFFLTAALVYIAPGSRRYILNGFLIVFGLSACVAFFQFLKIPPFLKIADFYTYKSIDNWDGTVGLRAVGLTAYPIALAFQSLIGLAIVGARAVTRAPNRFELMLMFFFSATTIASQARVTYAALFLIWGIFLIFLFKHRPGWALATVFLGVAFLGAGVYFAPNRLGYALQSFSLKDDSSFSHRANVIWARADHLLKEHPHFGIGPDARYFLGSKYVATDEYNEGGVIMESAYRVILLMFGLPGLMFLLLAYGGAVVTSVAVLANARESDERRQMGFVCLSGVMILTVMGYSVNVYDSYVFGPTVFLLAGLAMKTRLEIQAKPRRQPLVEPFASSRPIDRF